MRSTLTTRSFLIAAMPGARPSLTLGDRNRELARWQRDEASSLVSVEQEEQTGCRDGYRRWVVEIIGGECGAESGSPPGT